MTSLSLARIDNRPYLDRALAYGMDNGLISREKLRAIEEQGAKGIVQIAGYFGTAHLRADLELAMRRMTYLASLYLEAHTEGDLDKAARSLRDNTFLSHSRGGSDMLKQLHAQMDAGFDSGDVDKDVRDFLDQFTAKTQLTLKQYQHRMAHQDAQYTLMEAAVWLGTTMGLKEETVLEQDPESVIRTALLTRSMGTRTQPLMRGPLLTSKAFSDLLKSMRSKALGGGSTGGKTVFPSALTADVPEPYQTVIEDIQREITQRHLPKIRDLSLPLNQLFDDLSPLYWRRPTDAQDVSGFDTLVTDEWRGMTGGKTDDDSLNTVFLCVCAGLPPKPVISAAQARKALQTLREQGIQAEAVITFLQQNAPFEMLDGLLAQWNDEFLPDLQTYALDATVTGRERAMAFLGDHCCIKAPAKRNAKT
jgi:hypothetical protein